MLLGTVKLLFVSLGKCSCLRFSANMLWKKEMWFEHFQHPKSDLLLLNAIVSQFFFKTLSASFGFFKVQTLKGVSDNMTSIFNILLSIPVSFLVQLASKVITLQLILVTKIVHP